MLRSEYRPIHDDDDESSISSNSLKYIFFICFVMGVSFYFSSDMLSSPLSFSSLPGFVTHLESLSGNSRESSTSETFDSNANENIDLKFMLYREDYEPIGYIKEASDLYYYTVLEDYVSVLEPYVNNALYVHGVDTSLFFRYKFSVCPYDSSGKVKSSFCQHAEYSSHKSTTVNIECSAYDEYYVKVSQYTEDNSTAFRTETGKALCLYVRRDIGTLTFNDLSDTLDAMYALWSTDEEEGRELYGDDFHNITWIVKAHTFNAAQQDADHIHEGMGFLPQHIKITNFLEKAMQAVNPAVTLFYWDYTYEDGDLTDSVMFTEATFGTIINPTNTYWGWTYSDDNLLDAAIHDGRWEKLKSDYVYDSHTPRNSFGFMRAPWNMNPSPYISRFAVLHSNLPTCTSFYDWLSMTEFTDFMKHAAFAPHASTHGDVGAQIGCDLFDDLLEANAIKDASSQHALCKNWFSTLKELYRANFISPRTDCSVTSYDYDGIDCGFICDDSQKDDMKTTLEKLIQKSYVPSDMDDDGWNMWYDFICSGDGYKVFAGDHLEAASPADPSFWPIHPNLERMFHLKLMSGGFADSTWPVVRDDVCDKSECYEREAGEKVESDQCCRGHFEYDQLLDFINGNVTGGYGLTNKDMMMQTNPVKTGAYKMPYIYDDFTWSHCDEDFVGLVMDLKKQSR